jgi:hypothetical protein
MQTTPLILFFFFLLPLLVYGQDDGSAGSVPFLDYWPIVLLPIFIVVLYRFWKKRKK